MESSTADITTKTVTKTVYDILDSIGRMQTSWGLLVAIALILAFTVCLITFRKKVNRDSKLQIQAFIKVKKYIPSNKALFSRFYEDLYTFKYDECGIDKENTTDYFKVICFHNSDKFITMFPCAEGRELEYVDLNYLIPNDDNKELKN